MINRMHYYMYDPSLVLLFPSHLQIATSVRQTRQSREREEAKKRKETKKEGKSRRAREQARDWIWIIGHNYSNTGDCHFHPFPATIFASYLTFCCSHHISPSYISSLPSLVPATPLFLSILFTRTVSLSPLLPAVLYAPRGEIDTT